MITLTLYRDEPEQQPTEVGSIAYDGTAPAFTGIGEQVAADLAVRIPDGSRVTFTDAPVYWLRHAAARYSNGYGYATLSDDPALASEVAA